MLSGEVEVINSGESEVHLTGYQTITNMLEGDFPPSSPSLSEDDEDFEEELAQKQLAGAVGHSKQSRQSSIGMAHLFMIEVNYPMLSES